MNRIHLSLTSIAAEDFNSTLASAFNILHPADLMIIPSFNGDGFLYRKKIDRDFFLTFWKFTLSKKISIYKKPAIPAGDHKSISIIYVLQGAGNIDTGSLNTIKLNLLERTTLLIADGSELKFEIPDGNLIKVMSIQIDLDWIKKEFSSSNTFYETYFNTLYKKINFKALVYATTLDDLNLISEIGNNLNTGGDNLLFLKAKTFLLVSNFFSRVFSGPIANKDQPKILHYEQIMEVEKILKDHFEKKLPDLNILAKKISVSPSTLKRHFKLIFGKNIYQYYLELKMNYARELFIKNSFSVGEVANLLQYENVSGFIEMFKKHHGVSPGSLIKQSH